MHTLIRSGMEPTFRSLAGLFDDAAKLGGMVYYHRNTEGFGVSLNRMNAVFKRAELNYRLSDAQLNELQHVVTTCTGDAFQMAARMGYQNVENI